MGRTSRQPSDPAYIYALVDPRTGEIRYVGQTVDPTGRFKSHLHYHDRGPKSRWIVKLLDMGLKPTMTILEEITYGEIDNKERYWIRKMRKEGISLLNISEGGDKPPRPSAEDYKKAGEARRGQKDSPETVANKKESAQSRVDRDGMNPDLYSPESIESRSKELSRQWATGERIYIKPSPEIMERANKRRSEANAGKTFLTREQYDEIAKKNSVTNKAKWERGDYDYRAKTGPKSEKEGRIYPEDHQDIVDLYEAGYGVKEIATYYDVHHKSISLVIDKYGVRKERIDHTEEIIRLYTEEMLSIEKIAERIEGISATVVKNRLKENSIPLRNKTSYSKMTPEMVMDAIERQKNGEKITDMAEKFGVKRSALQQRISTMKKKMGL